MAHTRALARAFRNRAGNFLLVLTDDYERIDFVLLEREVLGLTSEGPTRRGVTVRPRVLSVERRDPGWEAEAARFLEETALPDRYLALGLDRLARDVDPKRGNLGFIDYKSLGVRQLGSIYEGLLEFNVEIGDGERLPKSNGQTSEVHLVSDKGERKATGSYYTPDYIVKYIVRHTVGPVLDETLDALRPRLHEAEARFRKVVKRKVGLEGVTPDEPLLLQNVSGDVLRDLFDVHVARHFGVERAQEFLTLYGAEAMEAQPVHSIWPEYAPISTKPYSP